MKIALRYRDKHFVKHPDCLKLGVNNSSRYRNGERYIVYT